MASAVNWYPDVLPPEQRDFWEHRLRRGFPGFVLYDGTALAAVNRSASTTLIRLW